MQMKTGGFRLMISLLLIVAGAALAVGQAAGPLVRLVIEADSVTVGQEFVVTLRIDDAADIYGGSFRLVYDPQALEIVLVDDKAVTPGGFFAGQPGFTLKNSVDVQQGEIEYALTLTQPAEPVSGAGEVGTVVFRALADAPITIEPVEARLLSPQFTEVNGRRIAHQIDEVPTQMQGVTLNMDTTAITASEPQPAAQVVSAPAAPAVMPAGASSSKDLVMIVGALLFVVGLATFAASLSAYTGLRRQYNHYRRQMEQPVW
jgi:hypothetical protein